MTAAASGAQILTLTGLRFDASLGVLDHEKTAPQPIQVDAELSLGRQPLAPRDDDLAHVLDYRRVRQIIIDECTAVQGVRVKIAKLEIFDDCEVAIRVETGAW